MLGLSCFTKAWVMWLWFSTVWEISKAVHIEASFFSRKGELVSAFASVLEPKINQEVVFLLHPQLANEEDPEGSPQVAAEAPPPYSSVAVDSAGKTMAHPDHCPVLRLSCHRCLPKSIQILDTKCWLNVYLMRFNNSCNLNLHSLYISFHYCWVKSFVGMNCFPAEISHVYEQHL